MPTPVYSTSGSPQKGRTSPIMRVPQARVMAALMPTYPEDPPFEWPLLTRAALSLRAGYTAISGTVTRALNGIRPSSSCGNPQTGLLELGYIETVQLDIDGVVETNYRATSSGIVAYQAYVASGKGIPTVRDAGRCTNCRYIKRRKM